MISQFIFYLIIKNGFRLSDFEKEKNFSALDSVLILLWKENRILVIPVPNQSEEDAGS